MVLQRPRVDGWALERDVYAMRMEEGDELGIVSLTRWDSSRLHMHVSHPGKHKALNRTLTLQ